MRKHECPRCGKKAFSLDEDWTSASCSKCGFSVDYKKMPLLSNALDLMKTFRYACKWDESDGK